MKYAAPTQLKLAIVAMGVIGIITPTASVLATTHILRQTIHADNRCGYTTLAAAEGNVNALDCEAFAPSVGGVVIDDKGMLTLSGVYDAAHSGTSLIVRFAGKEYTIGEGMIQTNGNKWSLVIDLTKVSPALQPTTEYTGQVISTTTPPHSSVAQRYEVAFTVTTPLHIVAPVAPGNNSSASQQSLPQRIVTALANTGQNIWLIIVGAGGMILVAGWLLIRRHKRGRRKGG